MVVVYPVRCAAVARRALTESIHTPTIIWCPRRLLWPKCTLYTLGDYTFNSQIHSSDITQLKLVREGGGGAYLRSSLLSLATPLPYRPPHRHSIPGQHQDPSANQQRRTFVVHVPHHHRRTVPPTVKLPLWCAYPRSSPPGDGGYGSVNRAFRKCLSHTPTVSREDGTTGYCDQDRHVYHARWYRCIAR